MVPKGIDTISIVSILFHTTSSQLVYVQTQNFVYRHEFVILSTSMY